MIDRLEVEDYSVEYLELPETVEAYGTTCHVIGIDEYAIQYAYSVRKIKLPETIKYIAKNAFQCRSLEELVLPASCLYAAPGAICNMSNLKKVTMYTTEKPVFAEDNFRNLHEDCELYTYADIDPNKAPWCNFKKVHMMTAGMEITTTETSDDTIYNLQGMPVVNLKKGEIYIRNGKKFVAQ